MTHLKPSIRAGFLASHGGTSFRVIMERRETYPINIIPAVLITNNPDAAALTVAATYNVPSCAINKKIYGEENVDRKICECLIENKAEIVLLTGYMRKIGPQTLKAFENRILNSHPALLPKFGGQDMYGRRVHEAVIAADEKTSGVTVHLVDKEYDTGPIVIQKSISLAPDKTVETLEERVKALEADAYVEAILELSKARLR